MSREMSREEFLKADYEQKLQSLKDGCITEWSLYVNSEYFHKHKRRTLYGMVWRIFVISVKRIIFYKDE